MQVVATQGGRSVTEQQRVILSLAIPACAEVNRAMQELTCMSFNSVELNKDMTKSRLADTSGLPK